MICSKTGEIKRGLSQVRQASIYGADEYQHTARYSRLSNLELRHHHDVV